MKPLYFILIVLVSFVSHAQNYFPINNGVKTENSKQIMLTGATIHMNPLQKIDNGMLLIENGKVKAIGIALKIPQNAIVIDFKGKHIYPSFVELHSNFGIAAIKSKSSGRRSVQYNANRKGYYWNDHIIPDYNSSSDFKYDSKKAKELRAAGFGVVNAHRKEGIHRGSSVLVALNDIQDNGYRMIEDRAAQHLSFKKK